MEWLNRSGLVVVLALMMGGPSAAQRPTTGSAGDAQILEQIETAEKALDPKVRNYDVDKWLAVVTNDYNEFDNYYPFLLEGRSAHRAIQGAWDRYDSPHTGNGDPARHLTHIQVYGDVAIVASYSIEKNDPILGGVANLQQRRKNTMVWLKTGSGWILAFCNCEWVSSPDGLPYPQ